MLDQLLLVSVVQQLLLVGLLLFTGILDCWSIILLEFWCIWSIILLEFWSLFYWKYALLLVGFFFFGLMLMMLRVQ